MPPEIAPSPSHRTWAEIDLEALRHNATAVRNRTGTEVRIMAIVKANAYGHGIGPVVRALANHVDLFGVANVAEARELRSSLPSAEVFILGPALPEERAEIATSRFIPSVSNADEARAFGELANGNPLPIHFIVDTGMGRIGAWQEDALQMIEKIGAIPGVTITGVASHLPAADEDNHFTQRQLVRFHALVVQIRMAGIPAPVVHVENSAGVLGHVQQAGDMVRPGIMLYGHAPLPQWQHCLRPTLTWKTRITLLRDVGAGRSISYGRTYITPRATRIATLGVGYADGYQRHLSGQNAQVLIGGRRCAVLGRVTMDQIMVDIGAVGDVAVGDEAVLIGRQGHEEITVAELANKAGTIPWEIFTGLGRRVAREYIGV
ncbi:MAG: alanine racemase [Chthoniobacteraceae bacterium]